MRSPTYLPGHDASGEHEDDAVGLDAASGGVFVFLAGSRFDVFGEGDRCDREESILATKAFALRPTPYASAGKEHRRPPTSPPLAGQRFQQGLPVIVDTTGHLGTTTSSARYKDDIKPRDKASEAILALQPVTFRYKKELDPAAIPQFGPVAEEVAKVDLNLVARDDQGKPYTVRYEAVNAMLLNEFLKEHKRNEKQEATIAELKSQVQVLTATLKEQAAQIQKVSAQVAATEPAARLVTNQ
jgi:hypothetical protein